MDPTGLALIFGGLVSLIMGLELRLTQDDERPKPRWPTSGPRDPHDRIRPRWCYWLGLGLIVVGILW